MTGLAMALFSVSATIGSGAAHAQPKMLNIEHLYKPQHSLQSAIAVPVSPSLQASGQRVASGTCSVLADLPARLSQDISLAFLRVSAGRDLSVARTMAVSRLSRSPSEVSLKLTAPRDGPSRAVHPLPYGRPDPRHELGTSLRMPASTCAMPWVFHPVRACPPSVAQVPAGSIRSSGVLASPHRVALSHNPLRAALAPPGPSGAGAERAQPPLPAFMHTS